MSALREARMNSSDANARDHLSNATGSDQGGDRGTTRAAADVLKERARQVSAEGWTPSHDAEHDDGELALAAACYVAANHVFRTKSVPLEIWHNGRAQAGDPEWTASRETAVVPELWPFAGKWWKPRDQRSNLVRAGALILAEIERIDRLGCVSSNPSVSGSEGSTASTEQSNGLKTNSFRRPE